MPEVWLNLITKYYAELWKSCNLRVKDVPLIIISTNIFFAGYRKPLSFCKLYIQEALNKKKEDLQSKLETTKFHSCNDDFEFITALEKD